MDAAQQRRRSADGDSFGLDPARRRRCRARSTTGGHRERHVSRHHDVECLESSADVSRAADFAWHSRIAAVAGDRAAPLSGRDAAGQIARRSADRAARGAQRGAECGTSPGAGRPARSVGPVSGSRRAFARDAPSARRRFLFGGLYCNVPLGVESIVQWAGDEGQAAYEKAKAQASALYLFFYYLGSSVAGTIGGWFFSRAGWPGVVALVGALSGGALVVALRLAKVPPPRHLAGN